MAAAGPGNLSPNASNPDEVDFHQLRLFMVNHCNSLPDIAQQVSPDIESDTICEYVHNNHDLPFTFHRLRLLCHLPP